MVFENKKMDREKIKIGIITLHRAEKSDRLGLFSLFKTIYNFYKSKKRL